VQRGAHAGDADAIFFLNNDTIVRAGRSTGSPQRSKNRRRRRWTEVAAR